MFGLINIFKNIKYNIVPLHESYMPMTGVAVIASRCFNINVFICVLLRNKLSGIWKTVDGFGS